MKQDINEKIEVIDSKIISFAHKFSARIAQIAIAVIFIWFGGLKLIGLSPAEDFIVALVTSINPLFIPDSFVVGIGVLELLIGLTILDSDFIRLSVVLLILHLVLTSLPLVFLADVTWTGFLVPSFEGQYILKNLLIVVAGLSIIGNLSHLRSHTPQTLSS